MQTERLKGFIPKIEFLDEMTQMFADKDFIACYGVYFDRKICEERILSDINHWQEFGFGPFYFRDKITDEFVGRGGLKSCTVEEKKEIELAYAINPKFWGLGIAEEIGLNAISLARKSGLKKLTCFTIPTNKQSLRVMQKLGFVFEKNFIYNNRPHKLHFLYLD